MRTQVQRPVAAGVSLRCASFAASVVQSRRLSLNAGHIAGIESPGLWERHPDRNPGFPVSSCTSNLYSTPLPDPSPVFGAQTTSLRRSPAFTGCASERIQFKLAMLILRSLHGLAPQYLADDLIRVADMPSRHRLGSARTHRLEVPRVPRATIGDRTFHAVGSRLWNSLPSVVVDCQTDCRHIPSSAETFLVSCLTFDISFVFFCV